MLLCRTCLKITTASDLIPLFDGGLLPSKIEALSSVKITEESNLPSMVCAQCVLNIDLAYQFRLLIIDTDFKLHHYIDDYTDISQTPVYEHLIKTEVDQDDHISRTNSPTLDDNELEETKDGITIHEICLDNLKFEVVRATTPPRVYKCRKCDFETMKHKLLCKHRKAVHKPITAVVCSTCGKSLLPQNMRKHTLGHYSLPVACDVCGRMCKNEESRRHHMMYHREQEIICHICGKSYRHPTKYSEHLRMHSNPTKEKRFQCAFCGKLFTVRESLKQHIRSHTGERPYPCELCKKGFSSRFALKTHKRQHTKERPYVCSLCTMDFAQRVSLRTHLKSKHNVEDPKVKIESISFDS